MKFVRTLTIEMEEEAQTIGGIWGVTDERADELKEMLAEWIKESNKWSEVYRKIFENLDGNEAMYVFGLLNYMWGVEDGKTEAMAEMITAMKSGRAGQ